MNAAVLRWSSANQDRFTELSWGMFEILAAIGSKFIFSRLQSSQ
jgi:hypothetical protein